MTELRRFRPTKRDPEGRRILQEAVLLGGPPTLIPPPDDTDTETLLEGGEVAVSANPRPPWEVGEVLSIIDKDWRVVCRAEVIAALDVEERAAYRLRGLPLGGLDD